MSTQDQPPPERVALERVEPAHRHDAQPAQARHPDQPSPTRRGGAGSGPGFRLAGESGRTRAGRASPTAQPERGHQGHGGDEPGRGPDVEDQVVWVLDLLARLGRLWPRYAPPKFPGPTPVQKVRDRRVGVASSPPATRAGAGGGVRRAGVGDDVPGPGPVLPAIAERLRRLGEYLAVELARRHAAPRRARRSATPGRGRSRAGPGSGTTCRERQAKTRSAARSPR
jgi:hypothetical protein